MVKLELGDSEVLWLGECLSDITGKGDTTKLYLTYSQLSSKIQPASLNLKGETNELTDYLSSQEANSLQLARIYLLSQVLEKDFNYFVQKVARIIQVADQSELITLLKFLILLPQPGSFVMTAVESLRTNITPVFEAISMKNPYPATYFNDQQWNQMYLKAAFMQLELQNIIGVEDRSNQELARIISDYAHERWAASRKIDPVIWRPVTKFLNEGLLEDMKVLLESDDPEENKAGALCCYYSDQKNATTLLSDYPKLIKEIEEGNLKWKKIKD